MFTTEPPTGAGSVSPGLLHEKFFLGGESSDELKPIPRFAPEGGDVASARIPGFPCLSCQWHGSVSAGVQSVSETSKSLLVLVTFVRSSVTVRLFPVSVTFGTKVTVPAPFDHDSPLAGVKLAPVRNVWVSVAPL